MLDIDKVMEYREPEYQLGQWLQPRAPQLEATSPRDPREPVDFVALECSSCEKAIQGSHFECVGDGCACTHTHGRSVFCETCSREPNSKHRPDTLRKIHKRCVLSDCLSEEAAQRACRCPGLGAPSKPDNTTYSSSSSSGPGSERPQRPLFPFGAGDRDRHEQTCALARLRRRHERAKVTELQRLGMLEETPEGDGGEAGGLPALAAARAAVRAAVGVASRAGARATKVADNIPYGNVHMSLMVGPLIIENGVPQSSLWSAKEHLPRHRRVKAFMKQVVGSPFWGVGGASDTSMEARIVRAVAEASLKYAENPRKSARFNEQRKASLRGKILRDIQTLLHARLRSYLRAIAGRLLDREVPLAWHILDNNCQRFCDAIIDRRVFGSFMLHRRNESCVTRRVVPASRDAAANRHTEEFLLRHRRVGHHNDTDIVDGLTEYWTDWGGFRAPVFRHQGLFPWDCTEARTAADEAEAPQVRSTSAGERRFYAPASSGDAAAAAQLSLDGWRHNRLGVVEAMRALGGGGRGHARVARVPARVLVELRAARARVPGRQGRPARAQAVPAEAWPVGRAAAPAALEGGERGAAVVVVDHDRVKLAGVHRAQPASHLYEHSMLHDCTVAGWADMAPWEQVAAYVALRDARAVDVDGVIKKAAREDASTGRSRRAEGGQDGSSQDPGGAALLDPGAASAQPIGEGGDAWEAYEAGDVVLEGHDYCDGQGTCDCVCDVNAGVDYTDGGEAITADWFVPFEIGDGDGNVGDGRGGDGGGDGGGGVGDGGGGGGGVGDGGGIGFVFFSIGDGGGGGGGGCGG
ncbi:hypothetical protein RB598_006557 [Gaeumannomyces tritici]